MVLFCPLNTSSTACSIARRDVEEYQKIEEEVHRSISTINGMFSTLSRLSFDAYCRDKKEWLELSSTREFS